MKIENRKNENKVKVFIPRESRNDNERFVAVNGERILVQTGVEVEIPERFAKVLANSERNAAESARFINENASV